MKGYRFRALAACALFLSIALPLCGLDCAGSSASLEQRSRLEKELASLVSDSDVAYLLQEISRIVPPGRITELDAYPERQSEQGGGLFGLVPRQLGEEPLPIPDGENGMFEAAIALARQRAKNLEAIAAVDPGYAFVFQGSPIPPGPGDSAPGMTLRLDVSAIRSFLDAYEDEKITPIEANELVHLESNRQMLRHRNGLSYMPPPKVSDETLKKMLMRAGSTDPLDRLWNWLHPMNNFGYADLAMQSREYESLIEEIEQSGHHLVESALAQVASFAPPGSTLDETFGFTVGFFIRGWATDRMPGLNIEQTKDDWGAILGTLTEETYHRFQLSLCPTSEGERAETFSDLAGADLGDERYDRLYELLAYTVLEGSANLARGENVFPELPQGVSAGIDLIDEYVATVVIGNDVSASDGMIGAGLRSNGPLYSLGWYWAGLVAESAGTRAVGELQRRGPVAFALRACELAAASGERNVSATTLAAIRDLDRLLGDRGRQ